MSQPATRWRAGRVPPTAETSAQVHYLDRLQQRHGSQALPRDLIGEIVSFASNAIYIGPDEDDPGQHRWATAPRQFVREVVRPPRRPEQAGIRPWDDDDCPNCGTDGVYEEDVYPTTGTDPDLARVCEVCDQRFCDECVEPLGVTCTVCQRVPEICGDCDAPLSKCEECDELVCDHCQKPCPRCDAFFCGPCYQKQAIRCTTCRSVYEGCGLCIDRVHDWSQCAQCGTDSCAFCVREEDSCERCRKTFCQACSGAQLATVGQQDRPNRLCRNCRTKRRGPNDATPRIRARVSD